MRGIIAGALAGFGKGVNDLADMSIKARIEDEQLEKRASLDVERAQTLALFQEQQKNAPMQRLQAKTQEYANELKPAEGNPDAGPVESPGFRGNVSDIQAGIAKMPEGAEKEATLAAFRQQLQADPSAGSTGIIGAQRKRSSQEAIDAALDDARVNDLPAYAAGRGLATEKTLKVGPNDTILDARTGKPIFSNTAGADRALALEDAKDRRIGEIEDRKDARQQAMFEAQEKLVALRQGAASGMIGSEERKRYTDLYQDSSRRMAEVQKTITTLKSKPLYAMAKAGSPQALELESLTQQFNEYKEERSLFGKLLAQGGQAASSSSPAVSFARPTGSAGGRSPSVAASAWKAGANY